MAISFHSDGIHFDLGQKIWHKQWIRKTIKSHQKIPGNLNFVFTSNEQLKLINRDYLNHNYLTDVITFDYTDEDFISGDIFIGMDQVKKNATFYEVEFEEELRRVMIHGVLHLLGFKDSSSVEKRSMREKENEALHLWLKKD